MLIVRGVSKTYGGTVPALNDVSFEIDRGVFGLLGPNGAGKSTLMRTLATLQRPDTGTITLNDMNLLDNHQLARRKTGYLPQDMGVYPRVSAREMLDHLASLKGLKGGNRRRDVADLLERVNLSDVADQRLDTYSGGMRRRFGIAAAFLGDPELVIVDEPTAGLDPSERRRFQLLLAEAARRCVLILSSHIVEDLAGLCTDMAVMRRGRIVRQGAPTVLTSDLSGRVWERMSDFDELTSLQAQTTVLSWRPSRGALVVRVYDETDPGDGFRPVEPDLEDLYAAEMR